MIDFRSFDPSHLTDLFYTFSGCSHLTTIYADSTWAAAFERHQRLTVLLQLQEPGRGQRNGMDELERELHVHVHRRGRAGGVPDGCLVPLPALEVGQQRAHEGYRLV